MRANQGRAGRATKGTGLVGAALALLGVALIVAAGGTPSAERAAAATPAGPVLPLPGNRGYPPKLDGPAVASQEVLPNLVAEFPGIPVVPADPGFPAVRAVTIGGTVHYLLFFDSGFRNSGPGPVLIRGHRASTKIRDMTADQYILLKNGSYALRRDVGALRYIYPTGIGLPHLHWHYLGAEVYATYPVGHFNRQRRSHKQGFCMSEFPVDFTNYCGYKSPEELTQVVGMAPHRADYYGAGVEGQDIDITGLSAGRYVLMNWLDSECQLKETTYRDNAASTSFRLSYPQGPHSMPVITLGAELNAVPHPACPAPAMDSAQAALYVRRAAAKESGGSVAGLRIQCTRASATGFTCSASWNRGSVTYSGRFSIAHVASSKLARYASPLDGISAQSTFVGSASGQSMRWSTNLLLLRSVQPAYPLPQ